MTEAAQRPAYIVVDGRIHDAAAMARYRELATVAVEQYGGRYLVRGGACETLEGGWSPERVVIVAFPSMAVARSFYESPEYGAARAARQGAAEFEMLLVEGL